MNEQPSLARYGSDVPMELVQRIDSARLELESSVAELREVMSDEEALGQFGIDVGRFLADRD